MKKTQQITRRGETCIFPEPRSGKTAEVVRYQIPVGRPVPLRVAVSKAKIMVQVGTQRAEAAFPSTRIEDLRIGVNWARATIGRIKIVGR